MCDIPWYTKMWLIPSYYIYQWYLYVKQKYINYKNYKANAPYMKTLKKWDESSKRMERNAKLMIFKR